jgi:hypothetical protein
VALKLARSIVLTGVALLMIGLPMAAHHSFAAEYDSNKKIELKGVVTKDQSARAFLHRCRRSERQSG